VFCAEPSWEEIGTEEGGFGITPGVGEIAVEESVIAYKNAATRAALLQPDLVRLQVMGFALLLGAAEVVFVAGLFTQTISADRLSRSS
jgi:hypothetical protein